MSTRDITDGIPAKDAIVRAAAGVGARVYFVGGCVRDLLLGLPVVDIDIVPFDVPYETVAHAAAKQLKATAVPFKDNVRLVKNDLVIDVSAPRGTTIDEDLTMRDFTVNSLALSVYGVLIGDDADISRRVIRMTSERSFADDPLRIVRAFRFAATLGFDIDEHTLFAARASACSVNRVAVERVYAELTKLAGGPFVSRALEQMRASGVLCHVIPELALVDEAELKRAVEIAGRVAVTDGSVPAEMLGALLSPTASGATAKSVMRSLNAPNRDAALVERLVSSADAVENLEAESPDMLARKKFAYRAGDDLAAMIRVDAARRGDRDIHGALIIARDGLNLSAKKRFGGKELLAMGFTPGPLFSTMLDELYEMLATGELENVDAVPGYIKHRWGSGKSGA